MSEQYPGPGSTEQPTSVPGASQTGGTLSDRQKEMLSRIRPAADDLVARGRGLYEQGNQRRFIVEHDGRTMVNLPLTVAALAGIVTAIVAPWAAVLAVLAAVFTRVSVRIEGEKR